VIDTCEFSIGEAVAAKDGDELDAGHMHVAEAERPVLTSGGPQPQPKKK